MIKDKIIKQIFKRLNRLETAVFGRGNNSQRKKVSKIHNHRKNSLPELILQLRKQSFFKQLKTAKEVHSKLEKIYSCELNRVEVALVRLRKAKELRKTTKVVSGKKITAYVW